MTYAQRKAAELQGAAQVATTNGLLNKVNTWCGNTAADLISGGSIAKDAYSIRMEANKQARIARLLAA